jgi:ABC-type phosphate transport system substrate-binding protein
LSFPKPTAAEIARLNAVPGLDIIFGVPVTLNLYRALQAAQGLTGDDAPANAPSLTSSQIRGLYTQRLQNWDSLRGAAGEPLWQVAGVTDPANAAQSTALDSRVFICRRVATSGTQASTESYFLQQRCDAAAGGASTGPLVFAGGNPTTGSSAAPSFNTRVVAGAGSGDVRTCLNGHHTNGTWAMGVLSTEVGDTQVGNIRFVRIDGALPNLATVANGDYTFFTTNTINRVAPGLTGEPTGLTLTLLQYIEANLGRPIVLSLANNSFDGRPWGDGGLLSFATAAGVTPNAAPQVDGAAGTPGVVGTMDGNPVNTQSRAEVSNRVNNCNPPVMRRQSPAF